MRTDNVLGLLTACENERSILGRCGEFSFSLRAQKLKLLPGQNN